ncbi:hypothetical protein BL240_15085 [Pseudomonas putida]|uniref:Uncharacterized protein n=1 Tax=Pseudomonas putida TaxID=303 RepID=A0A1L5PRP8_PSEPU|nr:hypothetical protein BL240_15085 [Pseudomonas putida]
MGTAPHIAGRVSSRVNRFSCEHAPAAGKTPVWLNMAANACLLRRQAPGGGQSGRLNRSYGGCVNHC